MFENEDDDDFLSHDFNDELTRFEQMLNSGESTFFDSDQLDSFIDHYLLNNQLKKAMDCVNHAISFYPDNLGFKMRKAQVLSNLGRLNEALALLIQYDKFLSHDLEFLLTRASVHSQMRDSKTAIKYFEKALELSNDEERDEIFLDLAAEYQNMGSFDSAIRTLKLALESNPENEAAVHELAYCYDLKNDSDQAIITYQDYLDLQPYSFTTWYNLGNSFSKAERYADALWAYDYCTIIHDDFSSAYFNMGNIYLVLEEYNKAVECFEKCIEIDGEDAMALVYIAEAYEHMEEFDEAMEFYNRAKNLRPDLPEPWLGIGIVLDLLERTNEALPFLEKAIELEHLNADYLHVYATALIKVGEEVEATLTLIKALNINPLSNDILIDLSDLRSRVSVELAYDEINEHIESFELQGLALLYRVKYAWLAGKQMDALIFYREIIIDKPEMALKLMEIFPEAEHVPLLVELFNSAK